MRLHCSLIVMDGRAYRAGARPGRERGAEERAAACPCVGPDRAGRRLSTRAPAPDITRRGHERRPRGRLARHQSSGDLRLRASRTTGIEGGRLKVIRVLVVYAGAGHGGPGGDHGRIGETLEAAGLEVLVRPASKMTSPVSFDACVVGAGVYMGSWVRARHRLPRALCRHPGGAPGVAVQQWPLARILTGRERWRRSDRAGARSQPPAPEARGRRRIEELAQRIEPREHRVFDGVFDPVEPAARHLRAPRPDDAGLQEPPAARRLPRLGGNGAMGSIDCEGIAAWRRGRVSRNFRTARHERDWRERAGGHTRWDGDDAWRSRACASDSVRSRRSTA